MKEELEKIKAWKAKIDFYKQAVKDVKYISVEYAKKLIGI
jgi:hypothetical protein